jgi:GT2 family glycosyltransferase
MGKAHNTKTSNAQDTPLCSICIANYNGEEYLSACIESILNQDFEHSFEILIHDDASTDNSVSLIKNKYPQLRLLGSKENVGFCISNNRMVEEARGQFILLLNNDAALCQDALKTLLNASLTNGEGIYGLPQYNAQTGELIDIGSMFDLFLNPIPNKNKNQSEVGMIIGACLWLPRTLWDRLGGFPEWFGSLAEDMYICCLARLWGYPVKAISQSGFNHWVGKSLGGGKVLSNRKLSTTMKRRALSERNKTFVMLTCYPTPALLFLFPIHIFLLCLEGILLSLIKQDKKLWFDIYWHCFLEIYKNKKVLLKVRQHSISHRRYKLFFAFFKPFTLMPHKLFMLGKYGLPTIK